MDIAGPLTCTKKRNKFLLSIVDVFTKNVVLVPLKNTDSESIIKAFQKRWLPNYGYPEFLTTDGGTNFTSYEMQSYLHRKKNKASHYKSVPSFFKWVSRKIFLYNQRYGFCQFIFFTNRTQFVLF